MKHLTSALLLVSTAAVLAGCPGGKGDTDTSGIPGAGDLKPQHSEWEAVVKALPFPLADEGKINTITIGRSEFDENYANRGNIEVLFDHPEETISIEIRKYVFGDEIDANGDESIDQKGTFERLSLWAFVSSGNPGKPSGQDPAKDCTKGTWKDGCAVYAYYDGKSQPARSGMDFRVHLPTGYRGKLFVETEDNTEEQSYPRRGNVTIDGWCSGGEVKLEAATAKIKMCDTLTPAPTCNADGIAACDNYVDPVTMEPAAWAKECGACGDGTLFGQLLINAPQPWAANITVDIPKGVWLNSTLQNTSVMKPHDCKPVIEACANGDIPCTLNEDDQYAPTAEFNYPSEAAPAGAGFNLTVISGGCTKIPFVDDPDEWQGLDVDPPDELRGLLKVCSGCL